MSSTGNIAVAQAQLELRQSKQSIYPQPLVCTVDAMIAALGSVAGQFVDFDTQFGGVPNGVNDNTPQMNMAIAYLATFPNAVTNHVSTRPFIIMSAGIYVFNSAWNTITFAGFGLAGQKGTVIKWNGTTALANLGTFTATPSNYYGGAAENYYFSNLSFINTAGNTPGARTGTFIQDNGSGGGKLYNIKFFGAQFGFAGAYGVDFIDFFSCGGDSCDHCFYFGPGSQQINMFGTYDFASCYASTFGVVLENVGSFNAFGLMFVNCGFIGSTNHGGAHVNIIGNAVGDPTLLGVTTLSSPFPINVPKNFYAPWHESNAAGLGYFPQFLYLFSGTFVADAIRGITVDHGIFVGGMTGISSAIFGSTLNGGGAGAVQLLELINPNIQMIMDGIFGAGCRRCRYRDINTVTGTALAPIFVGNADNPIDMTEYFASSIPTSGYWVRGTKVKSYLAALNVATTEVFEGWVRITDGTKVLSNTSTDWSLAWSLTT